MRSLISSLLVPALLVSHARATAAAPSAATPRVPTSSAPTDPRVPTSGAATTSAPVPANGAASAPQSAGAPPPSPEAPPPTIPLAPRPRIALVEMSVQSDDPSPALAMQLQDGFVLALVTGGVDVLDPIDVTGRIADEPSLQKCETSPCLKRLGLRLGVRNVLRVRVETTGNNYRMTARLFSTEGPAPAALPRDTKTRPCDVCTAHEARGMMIRLADDVRPLLEEKFAPPPPLPPPPPPPSLLVPIGAAAVGLLALAAGGLIVGRSSGQDKRGPAFGGALAGAGAAFMSIGLYFSFDRWPHRPRAASQAKP